MKIEKAESRKGGERILHWIKIVNLVAVCVLTPIMLFALVYALTPIQEGNFSDPLIMMVLGYLLALVFSLLAFFKKNHFLWLSLVGWMIFGMAYSADVKEAKEENAQICEEVRADPSCIENECGFECSDFRGTGVEFVTSGFVCKDKDMSLCGSKIKESEVSKSVGIADQDRRCNSDEECVIFQPDCGDCKFDTLNKNALSKYQEAKEDYCSSLNGPIVMCDVLFSGKEKCINNECVIK